MAMPLPQQSKTLSCHCPRRSDALRPTKHRFGSEQTRQRCILRVLHWFLNKGKAFSVLISGFMVLFSAFRYRPCA